MNDHRQFHLMRMTFPTDAPGGGRGNFSSTFRLPLLWSVVAADWSVPGEVTMTFLIPGQAPFDPEVQS